MDFICFATKRKYETIRTLKCGNSKIIYLISCKCYWKQYVGSTTDFKKRFRIHLNNTNNSKIR